MTPYVFCHLSLQSISQINLNGVRWNLKQDFPDAQICKQIEIEIHSRLLQSLFQDADT